MDQENQYQYDEIDLMDVFRILMKSWKLITILFLLAVLVVGSVTYFFIPKKYMSYTTFYLQAEGPFTSRFRSMNMTRELIESDEFLRNTLKQLGFSGAPEEVNRFLEALRIEETEAKNVRMEIIWDDPQMAQNILSNIYDRYIDEIGNKLEFYTTNKLKVAQEQYERNKEEFEKVSATLAEFQNKHNIFFIPPQLAISDRYYNEMKTQLVDSHQALIEYGAIMAQQSALKENYIKAYNILENTRRDVAIERNYTFITIDPPIYPEKKHSPSTVKNTVIAGFLALFVGVMLAFVREYIRNYQERER